jgi:O-methyltransferase
MLRRLSNARRDRARGPAPADSHPDLPDEFRTLHARCAPFTMTSVERMYALYEAARHVARSAIPGDYVECGVWRGGSSMLAALAFDAAGDAERTMWLYDTFEGMSEPTERDRAFDSERPVNQQWAQLKAEESVVLARASLDDVKGGVRSVGIPPDRFNYVVGKVEDTVPARAPDQIALLRLDTDWYESTRHELEHLWPRLAPGGVLIVDDYGHWAGAREAVDEYFGGRADAPLPARIDYTGRLAVKR